jgi:hypothetical protein
MGVIIVRNLELTISNIQTVTILTLQNLDMF